MPDTTADWKAYLPLLTSAIAVVSAVGVAYFAHRLSRRRDATSRFANAAREFRLAFAAELAILETRAELPQGLDTFLREAYDKKHLNAFAEFDLAISQDRRDAFRAAWREYHSDQEESGYPVDLMDERGLGNSEVLFFEYGSSWPELGADRRVFAAARIRALIAFAAPE